MVDSKKAQIDPTKVKVKVPESLRGGVYANTINVIATESEVTINFVYLTATTATEPEAVLTSRVIVPPALIGKIADALKQVSEEVKKEGIK